MNVGYRDTTIDLNDEMKLNQQKLLGFEELKRKCISEFEGLRTHLSKMEESYMNCLIAAEGQEKSLRNQLAELEDSNRAQSEVIQQLNKSGEQSKQELANELGLLKHEYTKLQSMNTNLNKELQNEKEYSQHLEKLGKFNEERVRARLAENRETTRCLADESNRKDDLIVKMVNQGIEQQQKTLQRIENLFNVLFSHSINQASSNNQQNPSSVS